MNPTIYIYIQMLLKLTCTLSKVLDEGAHPSTQQCMTSQSTVDVKKQLRSRVGGSTPMSLQFIDLTCSNQQLLRTLKDHTSCWYYENDVAVLEAICRWLQRNKTNFMAAYSSWYNTGINVWLIMGILWKSNNFVSYWGWHLLLYTYPCCNLL